MLGWRYALNDSNFQTQNYKVSQEGDRKIKGTNIFYIWVMFNYFNSL